MKKLIYLIGIILLMIGCTTNSEDTNNGMTEQIIEANAKGCGSCGSGQRPDCPPAKHYDWSKFDTIYNWGTSQAYNYSTIIFLGDGFTAAEETLFDSLALKAYNRLRFGAGGNGHYNRYNYYKAFMPSAQSGIGVSNQSAHPSIPSEMTGYGNTVFNTYSNAAGISYYTNIYHTNRYKLQQDLVGDGTIYWDNNECRNTEGGIFEREDRGDFADRFGVFVVMILNETDYMAGAEFLTVPGATTSDVMPFTVTTRVPNTHFSIATISRNATYFNFLLEHETGHSIWDLADEYVDPTYAVNGPLYEPGAFINPMRYNISDSEINPATQQYWDKPCYLPDHWVNTYAYEEWCGDPCTVILSDCGSPPPPPGLYENAHYYYPGAWYDGSAWKSTNYASIMETQGGPWSPLQLEICEGRNYFDRGAPLGQSPYMH